MIAKTNTEEEDANAIVVASVSRPKNTAKKALKALPKNCTGTNSGKRIPKYETSKNLRKPSYRPSGPNNTLEDRTDADNRLKEFIQGVRSTVLDGEEHWYDPSANRPYTLQEIADIMGVSRERVRQVEEQGLKRMWRLLSAMNRRENLEPTDWINIADSKHGEEDTIYMP